MALIISDQAQADFTAESISAAIVTQYIATITQLLQTQATLLAQTFTSDPNIPFIVPEAAVTDWNNCYVSLKESARDSSIQTAQISIYGNMYSLLTYTANAPLSTTDIYDQLLATFTLANNTNAITFLNDYLGIS